MHVLRSLPALLLSLCVAACTTGRPLQRDGAPSGVEGALETQRGWWRALATGDTAYLEAHSARLLSLTLSSGKTLDREATFVQAATFAGSPAPTFGWSDEAVRAVAPGVAIATTRASESAALATSAYRYTTVLERDGSGGA